MLTQTNASTNKQNWIFFFTSIAQQRQIRLFQHITPLLSFYIFISCQFFFLKLAAYITSQPTSPLIHLKPGPVFDLFPNRCLVSLQLKHLRFLLPPSVYDTGGRRSATVHRRTKHSLRNKGEVREREINLSGFNRDERDLSASWYDAYQIAKKKKRNGVYEKKSRCRLKESWLVFVLEFSY